MELTQEDFAGWKNDPVTRLFFQAMRNRIYELQVKLGDSAGLDPANDRAVVGMIRAYTELFGFEIEDLLEKE